MRIDGNGKCLIEDNKQRLTQVIINLSLKVLTHKVTFLIARYT